MRATTFSNVGLVFFQEELTDDIRSSLHRLLGPSIVKTQYPFEYWFRPTIRGLKGTPIGKMWWESHTKVRTQDGVTDLCDFCIHRMRKAIGNCHPCRPSLTSDWPKGWIRLLQNALPALSLEENTKAFYDSVFPEPDPETYYEANRTYLDIRTIPKEYLSEDESIMSVPYWFVYSKPDHLTLSFRLRQVEGEPHLRVKSDPSLQGNSSLIRAAARQASVRLDRWLASTFGYKKTIPLASIQQRIIYQSSVGHSDYRSESEDTYDTIERGVVSPAFTLYDKEYVHDDTYVYQHMPELLSSDGMMTFDYNAKRLKKDRDFLFDGKQIYKKIGTIDQVGFMVQKSRLRICKTGPSLLPAFDAYATHPFQLEGLSFHPSYLAHFSAFHKDEAVGGEAWILFPTDQHAKLRFAKGTVEAATDWTVTVGFFDGYFTETFQPKELIISRPVDA